MQVTKYLILVFEHSKIEDSQQLYMHFMKYCGDVATLAFCSAGPCFSHVSDAYITKSSFQISCTLTFQEIS